MYAQPGLAAAVTYHGETILTVGEGVTSKTCKSPCRPDGDTIFRAASITKVFVVSDGYESMSYRLLNCTEVQLSYLKICLCIFLSWSTCVVA